MASITIKADHENNAEAFWGNLDQTMPDLADNLRAGKVTVDTETWSKLKAIDGFSDGPCYAPNALIIDGDTYELYYAENSHDSECYQRDDFETVDWDAEGCEVNIVSENLSWDELLELADTTGLGIYLASKNDDNYSYAIRVAHGSAPEYRGL